MYELFIIYMVCSYIIEISYKLKLKIPDIIQIHLVDILSRSAIFINIVDSFIIYYIDYCLTIN